MIRRLARRALVLVWLVAVLTPAHPSRAAEQRPLTIFYASTLSGYVRELSRAFHSSHPSVEIRAEASGSLDAIRKVTDLHRNCDILLAADWRLLNRPLAGVAPWVAIFAGNAMAILYTPQSKYADAIDAQNWYRILMRPGVRDGHSDPARDPEGYWTLIVWQLAERYYGLPGLAAKLKAGCPLENTRPASVNLIALLQSGELDYYFGYASDARLAHLLVLALPAQINLSDFSQSARYASATVEIGSDDRRTRITGAPVAYGASLTSNPPNRKAAIAFLALMLGPEGRRAARQSGLVVYPRPFAVDPAGAMPPELRALTAPPGATGADR
jgi:molybdate/tungstate transport system substrate-binding protein